MKTERERKEKDFKPCSSKEKKKVKNEERKMEGIRREKTLDAVQERRKRMLGELEKMKGIRKGKYLG